MCLGCTLGGNLGSGQFYVAKKRTFLLCVNIKRIWDLSAGPISRRLLALFSRLAPAITREDQDYASV